MVKDRLSALQAVSFKAVKEWEADNLGLDLDDQDYGITNYAVEIDLDEEAGYMERFFKEVKQSRDWINTIVLNVAEIRNLHGNLLSSPRPDETMKAELDVRTDTIKQLAKRVNSNLKSLEKRISQEEEDLSEGDPVPAGLRIRRTQHATTLHLFVQAVTEFNLEQVDYKEKCEERIHRIASIAKAEVSDEKLEELLEQGNYGSIFNSDIITETQEARRALEDIQIRHEELLRLEKSIKELRDLFVEMAILVEQQGDLINSIEHHVLEAGEAVETAKVQTKKAIRYKGKARKKKIILLVIALVLILALVAYIYFSFIKPWIGNSGSGDSPRSVTTTTDYNHNHNHNHNHCCSSTGCT
ncbi:syntaxin-like isoform X1 [Homalodisca vitripennis]|uniref:syntaxin-like isoform X1 n=1 Tax=Homalodisca vitripennis TaxID=197043 RepID=UPI001EEBBC54|nr:syntaxin-like isoform X1 [Homalodisca vitripennis]